MSNEDGSVVVVFNGEIYNYLDIRARLKARGHYLKTESDTETIVHLYEDYELGFLGELRGMFALALWDRKRRRLVLARDRIGEKPLFYCNSERGLLFGSEIKCILQALPSRQVDRESILEFLAMGYVPAPRTIYSNIFKLFPGFMLIHENNEHRLVSYWSRSVRSERRSNLKDAESALREILVESVKLCLKSDVEVGAFLSGGIDSSVLVAIMRGFETQVRTFSVGFSGGASGFNELGFARLVAKRFETQHTELILEPNSTLNLLPRILWHYDEPHGEPTSVLVYLLSEFTRRAVKVALGGTGADELFCGYPRYAGLRLLRYYQMLPKIVRDRIVQRVVSMWPESTRGSRFAKRVKRFVNGGSEDSGESYLNWVSLFQRDVRADLVTTEEGGFQSGFAGERVLRSYLFGESGHGDMFTRAADLDIGSYLPEYQLAYVDRMSMAHGLEVRSPFCDFRLVEFASSLPIDFRLRGWKSKFLLKRVAREWLPRRITERKKVGFDSPVGEWLKTDLKDFVIEFLSAENIAKSGLLCPVGVQSILGEHMSGKRDYSLQLWSLVALEAWYRMYIEDEVFDGSQYALTDMRGVNPERSFRSVMK